MVVRPSTADGLQDVPRTSHIEIKKENWSMRPGLSLESCGVAFDSAVEHNIRKGFNTACITRRKSIGM